MYFKNIKVNKTEGTRERDEGGGRKKDKTVNISTDKFQLILTDFFLKR